MNDIIFTKDQVMKLCAEAHIEGQIDGMRLMCNNLIDILPQYRDKLLATISELKEKQHD